MPQHHSYATYIMAGYSHYLYIGVTNNLRRRVMEHKSNKNPGFTSKFNCHRLVWFVTFQYINNTIAKEKNLKHWTRARKLALIKSTNPTWQDLSQDWLPHGAPDSLMSANENGVKIAQKPTLQPATPAPPYPAPLPPETQAKNKP